MMNTLISDILFGFAALISIINPFGMAFVFYDSTAALAEHERRLLARKVAINSCLVLLVAFFVGTPVLHFFGISIEALRIGGGLSVSVSGWQMLTAPDTPASEPATHYTSATVASKALFPLTIPLTTGPGSIATAIALNAHRMHELSAFLLSAISSVAISVLVMVVIYLVYGHAARLARYFGAGGMRVAVRVSSFLLLCIGVQIMLTGFQGFLAPLASLHGAQ